MEVTRNVLETEFNQPATRTVILRGLEGIGFPLFQVAVRIVTAARPHIIKEQYEKNFDGPTYAKGFTRDLKFEYMWFMEEFYHRLFEEGKLQGKTLIDVGCGPSLRAPLVASRYGCEVVCADLLETNRNFVQNWLDKGHDAFDYSDQFKHVAQLEGNDDFGYLEERVKKSVKEVIFCDILADNPIHPRPSQQFDIVTSSLVLDAYPDQADYLKGAKAISSLIRPGGYLAFGSSIGGTYYKVGDKTLPSSNVDSAVAKKAFIEAGLKVLQICEYYFKEQVTGTDSKGFFTLYAIKL
uniref:Methyltransferase domain-containing protein n=1 Tax=Strigamia maritima TaxID=126957 RepID=T1J689_STRMM